MGWVLLVLLVAAIGAAVLASRSSKRKELERKQAELEPVKKLAFEDITALGMELQDLDEDLAGHELDKGTRADYQRALDAYESAKFSGDYMTKPEEITNVTKILDDGRYAIACVRARVAGQPLPSPPAGVLLRPAARDGRRGRPLRPAGRRRARRPRLRAGRRAGQGRRRARHPAGDGRLASGCPTGRAAAPTRRTPPATSAAFGPMEWMFVGADVRRRVRRPR